MSQKIDWNDLIYPEEKPEPSKQKKKEVSVPQKQPSIKPASVEKRPSAKDQEIAELKKQLKNLQESKERVVARLLTAEEINRDLEGQIREVRESEVVYVSDELTPEQRLNLKEIFKSYWSKWRRKGTGDRKDRFHLIREKFGFTLEELEREIPELE